MTYPVSLLLPQSGSMLPPPSVIGLSDDEQALVSGLSAKLVVQSPQVGLRWAYYDGLQRLNNLGVSVPPQLAGIRTVVDWPRVCVDPLVQRCKVDGFLMPGNTDVDTDFLALWQANDLDSEIPLAFLDALVTGRGFLVVGAPDDPGDPPIVTVESPLNMAVLWDPRTRRTTAAYQSYQVEGVYQAILYVPGQTIRMSRDQSSPWVVDEREEHGFDDVPVIRLVNRARTVDREGRSEITAAVMNTTDSACRSLLGMEIAREFYSIPHRYILGANESDFVDAMGVPKSAIDMAMNKFLALERDENGDVPTLGQFQAFDPSVFTKIIDEHAQLMASYTGFPPQYFGLTTTANPASADAIRVGMAGIDRRASEITAQFSGPLRRLAQLIWRFANDGDPLPDTLKHLDVAWADTSTPTPAATTDAITKQIASGVVPPTSDVTLKHLGYTAVERLRLAQDRDTAEQFVEEVSHDVEAKALRATKSLMADAAAPADVTAVPVPPVAAP